MLRCRSCGLMPSKSYVSRSVIFGQTLMSECCKARVDYVEVPADYPGFRPPGELIDEAYNKVAGHRLTPAEMVAARAHLDTVDEVPLHG